MKLLCLLAFLGLLSIASAGILGIGYTQSAAIRGVLICNGKPAANVKVKMFDEDLTDIDDLMAEGVTDSQGRFELRGHENEVTDIDPKLNVYHDCNDENVPCLKKFSIMIPDSYITKGEVASKIFDVGVLNLAGAFSGESRDCLN